MGGGLQLVDVLKDMLFPIFCLGCKKEGVWVCPDCLRRIDTRGITHCPVCHEPQAYGVCCEQCSPYSYLSSHIAGVAYEHGALVGRIIEAFKYGYVTELVDTLMLLLDPVIGQHKSLWANISYIVPIPLHARRYAERGYNQAALLAEALGRQVDIPVYPVLTRARYTTQQARLAKEEREANVADVFVLRSSYPCLDKDILLVDDVFTTGSTMQAAAAVLRRAGAASVAGISVARGD